MSVVSPLWSLFDLMESIFLWGQANFLAFFNSSTHFDTVKQGAGSEHGSCSSVSCLCKLCGQGGSFLASFVSFFSFLGDFSSCVGVCRLRFTNDVPSQDTGSKMS